MEINFDGIVGPTHNYSGLSYGNIASTSNQKQNSNPKEAALQGLEKMNFLTKLGIQQAVLPPQERPHIPSLKLLGFSGSDSEILLKAQKETPEILVNLSSAASMWTANAATMSPSIDSSDHKVHFTPANLNNKYHRSIEAFTTEKILKRIFSNPHFFVHHSPLPSGSVFADEGAANHTRLCKSYNTPGIQLFTFGRYGFKNNVHSPIHFPARQTFEASRSIKRLHELSEKNTIFIQQNPKAIDAGAFHNDVVSVGNKTIFLYHEEAFLDKINVIEQIKEKGLKHANINVRCLEVKSSEIPLKLAIDTYLFNSQIVSLPNGKTALIAPMECHQQPIIFNYIQENLSQEIDEIHFINVHQSMKNGGGPACLRLRVVLNQDEFNATHPFIFFNNKLYERLQIWVKKHYRDRLAPEDLADPLLLEESRVALDELTQILHLGSIYEFQAYA